MAIGASLLMDVTFGPQEGQITPKRDKSGTFYTSVIQNALKIIFQQSRICPKWADLIHYGLKTEVPGWIGNSRDPLQDVGKIGGFHGDWVRRTP